MSEYIVFPSKEVADNFSRLAHEMTHTNSNPVTTHSVLIVEHPETGEVAIEIPEDFKVTPSTAFRARPHPGKDISSKVSTNLPSNIANAMNTKIQESEGTETDIKEFLPAELRDAAKTRADMDADGWFPEVVI